VTRAMWRLLSDDIVGVGPGYEIKATADAPEPPVQLSLSFPETEGVT